MSDLVDIGDVLVRYSTGIDSRDWPLLRTCFTDDCDADYGEIGHWYGSEEITTWMEQSHAPLGPTMHRVTNIVAKVDGDAATSRCYVHAVVMTSDRSTAIHAYGWYDDELVRSTGGWRITRRRFNQVTTEMHTSARTGPTDSLTGASLR